MPNKATSRPTKLLLLRSGLHFIHINSCDKRDDIVDYFQCRFEDPSEVFYETIETILFSFHELASINDLQYTPQESIQHSSVSPLAFYKLCLTARRGRSKTKTKDTLFCCVMQYLLVALIYHFSYETWCRLTLLRLKRCA